MKRMMMVAGLTVVAAAAMARAEVSVTPIVSMKDARADFDAEKYSDCLKKIASLATLSSTSPMDRGALLMLKGDCLLAQKQGAMASEAFLAASSAYATAKDPKQAATARATSDLVKASTDFQYTPKTGKDRAPLPIIDAAKRPAALTAMYNDQLAIVQDAVKTQQARPVLSEMVDLGPKIQELVKLELAATGDDSVATGMRKSLGTTAKNSIDSFLATSTKRVDGIVASASKMITITVPGPVVNGKQTKSTQKQQEAGLSPADKTTLNGIVDDLDKVTPTTRNLAGALGTEIDFFKAQQTTSSTLRKRIENVLAGRYR